VDLLVLEEHRAVCQAFGCRLRSNKISLFDRADENASVLLCWLMAVLQSSELLSRLQRQVNKGALLLSAILGIGLGLWEAKACAATTFGYVAAYNYAGALFLAVGLYVIGLPLLIYWRTRWLGAGLVAAGILSYAVFYGGMAVLLREDRVAWRHEPPMVSFGPDQKASAVIYFRKEISDQQVEDSNSSVLERPAQPRHDGRDYPDFVRVYLRLLPSQANGHKAIALTFSGNAPTDKVDAYLTAIRADRRVETVFLNASPNSIHTLPSMPKAVQHN
jgi:hypothetical protein